MVIVFSVFMILYNAIKMPTGEGDHCLILIYEIVTGWLDRAKVSESGRHT